jgi:ketosteroid isomerase-like protein
LSEGSEKGKWIGTFRRQSDGSWKCAQLIWNSNQPAAGATADGAEEQALLQVERDWLNAALKKDRAALDKIIAADFIGRGEEGVKNKTQLISMLLSRSLKIESAEFNSMQPMVFGDTAIIYGMTTSKESMGGKDTSGQYRWTDIFQKRNGQWQCVGSYSKKVQ